ncbi:MAG: anhydro-N-acetylmuramic acid kinase [Gammaproteobacteria bacterium]|nr:anhydro-N-acetylmuramic acid kinase [Gammaproteobacteria bacterium]
MMDKYIGLMSGTSMDAVDTVLVSFESSTPRILAQHSLPLTDDLRQQLISLHQPGKDELNRLAKLDITLAQLLADTVNGLLIEAGCKAEEIIAIGSHGQTVRHIPDGDYRTTYQIGDPNLIAELTGITTVADFRRRDMAAGGQGAPLAPAFHNQVFRKAGLNRVIVNIGGIANITILPADEEEAVIGFDTGPGNGLMDAWIFKHQAKPYDSNGEWAASGELIPDLLNEYLSDPYFKLSIPKSTGKEYFHLDWLKKPIGKKTRAEDVQTTLCELTAVSIANAIKQTAPASDEIYVCGGGVENPVLMGRLAELVSPAKLATTSELGISPQWVEASCFAWLAKQTLQQQPGNLPSVTGASHPVILGGIFWGRAD